MDCCRETNIMKERHNDSDTEIVKIREGFVAWDRVEATTGGKIRLAERYSRFSVLSSPLLSFPHSQY